MTRGRPSAQPAVQQPANDGDHQQDHQQLERAAAQRQVETATTRRKDRSPPGLLPRILALYLVETAAALASLLRQGSFGHPAQSEQPSWKVHLPPRPRLGSSISPSSASSTCWSDASR